MFGRDPKFDESRLRSRNKSPSVSEFLSLRGNICNFRGLPLPAEYAVPVIKSHAEKPSGTATHQPLDTQGKWWVDLPLLGLGLLPESAALGAP